MVSRFKKLILLNLPVSRTKSNWKSTPKLKPVLLPSAKRCSPKLLEKGREGLCKFITNLKGRILEARSGQAKSFVPSKEMKMSSGKCFEYTKKLAKECLKISFCYTLIIKCTAASSSSSVYASSSTLSFSHDFFLSSAFEYGHHRRFNNVK